MFVSASTYCFAELPWLDACSQIADLDFDKVEIWMAEEGDHLRPSQIAADPDLFSTTYRENTRLSPVAFMLDGGFDVETFTGVMRAAKQLRVAQLTISSAPMGTPFNAEIDRLRELTALTGREGVRLSIKTKTGALTEDPHTAVELCQEVDGLGLTLDPSYYVCGPNRDKPYDQVFPHVYHLQLRDTTPETLQVPTGLGVIDYSRLITQLEREAFNQAFSIELLPEFIPQAERPLELRKLRMLLETLL